MVIKCEHVSPGPMSCCVCHGVSSHGREVAVLHPDDGSPAIGKICGDCSELCGNADGLIRRAMAARERHLEMVLAIDRLVKRLKAGVVTIYSRVEPRDELEGVNHASN